MTKSAFKTWLQVLIDEMNEDGNIDQNGIDCNCGDVWREMESEGLLDEIGVQYAMAHIDPTMFFKLDDGLLWCGFEIGIEGETVWVIPEFDVTNVLSNATPSSLDDAIGYARANLMSLEALQ